MKYLKNLLKQPIKKTFIVLIASFAIYIAISTLGFILDRALLDTNYRSNEDIALRIVRVVTHDFHLISRIVLEATLIVLASQVIYRLMRKES